MKYLLFILICFTFTNLRSQECKCNDIIKEFINSIESNYVDFKGKLKIFGEDNYYSERSRILRKSYFKSFYDCYKLTKEYASFFKEPHFSISLNSIQQNNKYFIKLFSSDIFFDKKLISSTKTKGLLKDNIYYGIWSDQFNTYQISFKKNGNKLFGIITKSDSIFWFRNQIKVILDIKKKKALFYTKDHVSQEIEYNIHDNIIDFGGYGKWYNEVSNIQAVQFDNKFFIKTLSDTVILFRLPNFELSSKSQIDSLIYSNYGIIKKGKILILDLRNNNGGYNISFENLLPFIKTDSTIYYSFGLRSSKDNINLYKEFANKVDLPDTSDFFKIIEKMELNKDSFFILSNHEVEQNLTLEKNFNKIFILANKYTASAAEALILLAKQNSKVKIIGQNTKGQFDNQNTILPRFLKSCNYIKYNCPIGTFVNFKKIDNIGIEPDIRILPDQDSFEYILEKIKNEK